MNKVIATIMVIIILFNITGCATTGNYYDKNISNKKQFSDEMLGSVLEDLERKQNERLLYNFGGAVLLGGGIFVIFYLAMITTSETPLPSFDSREGAIWAIPVIFTTLFGVGGWFLGGKFYDETHKKK